MFLIVILYAICASMFTISKHALLYSSPLFFMSFRMIGSGLLLLSYFIFDLFRHSSRLFKFGLLKSLYSWLKSISKYWAIIVQVVLFHVYFTYVFDLWALKKITSIESAFIYNLSPFLSAIFSYFWFGEKMNLKKWFGLCLGFFSLAPIFLGHDFNFNLLFINWVPKLLTLLAVASSAYGWVLVRVLVQKNYSPILINGFSMLVGGSMALITSLLFEFNLWNPVPVNDWNKFLYFSILIIVVANIVFYNLYGYLLKYYTATLLSFAGFMCPFFAAIFGWFFLGEPISYKLIISLILVITGLYIFYYEELQQGYVKD